MASRVKIILVYNQTLGVAAKPNEIHLDLTKKMQLSFQVIYFEGQAFGVSCSQQYCSNGHNRHKKSYVPISIIALPSDYKEVT